MTGANKPFKFVFVFAAFLLAFYFLLPGPQSATSNALTAFPGTEEHKKDDKSGSSQRPLKTTPTAIDSFNGIPAIGLGTWRATRAETVKAVKAALRAGIRHIDCAAVYGNEKQVGDALASSTARRSDIWITSKLWNTEHAPDRVLPALEQTLKDLGVPQLDLYLMHWPIAFSTFSLFSKPQLDPNISILETWKAMEELVRANLTRYIGISNFAKHDLTLLLQEAEIKPFAHEFENHPYLQQAEFVEWHQQQNITVIAYSPFANTNSAYQSDIPSILEDKILVAMAKKKKVSVAQILLKWGMKRGTVVIPKSSHEKRIVENLGSKDVELSEEDMGVIAGLDKKLRLSNPSKFWGADFFSDLDGR